MSTRAVMLILVMMVAIFGGGFAFLALQNDSNTAQNQQLQPRPTRQLTQDPTTTIYPTALPPTDTAGFILPDSQGVNYTDTGFVTTETEIQYNGIVGVVFKNTSTKNVDIQPDQDAQIFRNELQVGVLNPGQSKVIYFNEEGSYSFLNRLNPQERGSFRLKKI